MLRRGLRYIAATLARPVSIYKKLFFALLLPAAALLYPLTLATDAAIGWLKEHEWARNRALPNGSEMYCRFEKSN